MKTIDILSVGDVNIEVTLAGLPSMPKLGREILAENAYRTLGGSTVNTAVGLARLGLRSGFVGKVGRDDDGAFLIRTLEGFGVDASHMRTDDHAPTGITVSLATAGDRAMATCLGAIGTLTAAEIPDELLASARHLHVAGYFLQTALRPSLPALFDRAHALGLTVSLDTGWDDSERWEGVAALLQKTDIFFPNESEATAITGLADIHAAADRLSTLVRMAVVKHGPHGAILRTGDTALELPAYPGTPVDTTGAGDAFNAGFLGAYLRGMPLETSLRYGLAAGSISVTRPGSAASCPTLDEVRALVGE
ncbi:MAG: carbohydrate kinase family protein [Eubacteriales bacterium]|nr:carbohydrate kinase family protein [Clostridiales bacterium]MDY3071742.1 carbohydrate kinase family protein [Eubacteriales bacterium]